MNFNIEIENKSKEKELIILLKYSPNNNASRSFNFSNSNFLLERRDLKIIDSNSKVLHQDVIIHVRPRVLNKIETTISKENPFIYKIQGKLVEESNRVRLKLKSVEYLLEKNKEYSIYVQYGKEKSNELIFIT